MADQVPSDGLDLSDEAFQEYPNPSVGRGIVGAISLGIVLTSIGLAILFAIVLVSVWLIAPFTAPFLPPASP